MVYIEGGRFLMGSEGGLARDEEKPVHPVVLDSYYLGRYTVTQALWKTVMGNDKNPSFFQGEKRPVEQVPWFGAQVFIRELNLQTGKTYRLPTEAEWEYAARGGRYSLGYFYAGSNTLREVGWFSGNSPEETKEVGQKRPNELGLYDMSGNVWEWCWDWFSKKYYEECHKKGKVENPRGPAAGMYRVVRGGRWNSTDLGCRCTHRHRHRPGIRLRNYGLRLALPGEQMHNG